MRDRYLRLLVVFAIVASFVLVQPSAAQDLQSDLWKFTETPAVAGNEQALATAIRAQLGKLPVKTDNLGNLIVTVGSGSPHRVVVTAMDEVGYVVSGITPDGYLRVQRLPQAAPNAVFDLLHSAQPIQILTRKGTWVSGVFAGLSTHLQTARQNPPKDNNLDDVFVDIGAMSAEEVRAAGVDVLDPLTLERQVYDMGYNKWTAPAIGDRFGCAALVEVLRHLDVSKVRGTLTVAFVTEQQVGGRGLERLSEEIRADEMVYVGRLLARRATAGRGGQPGLPARAPQRVPGDGAVVGVLDPSAPLPEVAGILRDLAGPNNVELAVDFTAPLPRGRRTAAADALGGEPADAQAPSTIPLRFAHVGIPTHDPVTPAEMIDSSDLDHLTRLLEAYTQGLAQPAQRFSATPVKAPAPPGKPKVAPSAAAVLSALVESYGVSQNEAAVREAVMRLLPEWAKPETDATGNLILRLGTATKGSKTPRIAVVAHMDEIGYIVRTINPDGTIMVQSAGGGITEFFSGHTLFIHTSNGIRPGILELPKGWEAPNFEWPRPGGAQAQAQTEGTAAQTAGPGPLTWHMITGAHNADEVGQLGIKVGDWITVPKKYRKLVGTRANGRSFDDRVGCTALILATWALGPNLPGRDITFVWSTQEEIGLRGALASVRAMAAKNAAPDYVFAIDTFVSSDSPLESKRFADARLGRGFVARAVDSSNITPRPQVDRLLQMARAANIPMQYGVTGGGNDGSVFLRYGSIDVALGWPLRYSHSPGEVIDVRDTEALGRITTLISKSW